ncbi:hypothetical protein A2U01_0062663 [Trifolium medium]|uniref:Uncharacterized protein n=1 Tax=Trifolium medium TaxID=97028 RepID=A0A392S083_9FABA|nr:hypothetical protein [Trifolium medium]
MNRGATEIENKARSEIENRTAMVRGRRHEQRARTLGFACSVVARRTEEEAGAAAA